MHQFRIIVSGNVQGVSYRRFAKVWADKIGIMGWCRNLEDGNVEIMAEGSKEDIDRFAEKLKEGPLLSKVSGIEIKHEQKTSHFSTFVIKNTFL